MFTSEEITLFDRGQCESALKKLDKTYGLNKTIVRYTDDIDSIVNIVLDIRTRIEAIEVDEMVERCAVTKATNQGTEHLIGIMTPKGRADDLKSAAELMGYRQSTIYTYLTSKPEQYYRCE